MNIFKLSNEEFNAYLNSQEFQNSVLEYTEKIIAEDPYGAFAEECWNMKCKFCSACHHDLQMGQYPICRKFRWDEKNDCSQKVEGEWKWE